jgi:hypothetical protein
MARPNIQIDDEVREMTEEEHTQYLVSIANAPAIEDFEEE